MTIAPDVTVPSEDSKISKLRLVSPVSWWRRNPIRRLGFMDTWLGRLTIPFWVIVWVITVFALFRIALLLWFAGPRGARPGEVLSALAVGFQFDLLAALVFAAPQMLMLSLASNRMAMRPTFLWGLEFCWLSGFLFLPFLCAAEWLFFEEFQTRLNYIAFEYLVYPTEVCCNIWQSYSVVPLLGIVLFLGGGLFLWQRQRFLRTLEVPLTWQRRGIVLAVYFAATAGLWSLTSMADAEVSDNRIVNECANNGLYSFVTYAWTCHMDFNQLYLTIDEQEAFKTIQTAVIRTWDQHHDDSANPLDRSVWTARPRKDYNVVIILEESLGSDFVGVLGDDRQLSPEFDQLSKAGLLFDNFYATGNRTARALEAVLTSLPPLPTESILKREHSDRVFTLAHALAERGYQRLFMTGGRGVFDGVRSFMTANGFDQFLEQSDYEDPVFTNAWGVSDEDLFHRAVIEFDRLHETGQPFFSVVLTVSNHRPFTYPPGRIPEEGQSREHAVKYADWALGEFFRQARSRAFYSKTLFVVMGDHGARVYGSQMIPIESYRVPMLIIHPEAGFAGKRCHTLGCSMDVAPTIMGLLGGTYRSVFFGRDVTQLSPQDGLALMQHNHEVALLRADHHLTALSVGKNAWSFRLDPSSYRLDPLAYPDAVSLTQVISYFQTAYRLYSEERCFPGDSNTSPENETAPD